MQYLEFLRQYGLFSLNPTVYFQKKHLGDNIKADNLCELSAPYCKYNDKKRQKQEMLKCRHLILTSQRGRFLIVDG